MVAREVPDKLRSEDSSRFARHAIRDWIEEAAAQALFTHPILLCRDYYESFNSKLPDELLDGQVVNTLKKKNHTTASWRPDYNTTRPHFAMAPVY